MRNDQVQTSTMHSVTETGGYNHHNNHRWTTLETGSRKSEGTITTTITGEPHSKPDHGRYFYFSSVYVAQVLSGAADEKSSRRPGAVLEGIHDFVELQGQCVLQQLRRQRSLAITTVRVPPSRDKRRRSTAWHSSHREEGL